MSEAPADRLAWLDLEMTGLETNRHTIVEIAVLITDANLELVDEGIDLVDPRHRRGTRADGRLRARAMHTKSGLLPQIQAATLSLGEAGDQVLEYLRTHVAEHSAPLCGNSIGVDRRFLDRYLPAVDQYLHYRSIDVSSLKELARRWNPAVLKGQPTKKSTHRALDDIRESIEELRYYREAFLKLPADRRRASDA